MGLKTATCEVRELPRGKSAPKVIHLLPLGKFTGRDGRTWNLDNPAHLIASFKARKVDLPIDYEHQSEISVEAINGAIPAAGWITDLEARSDGIWGHVKWTEKAAKMIEAREYRYISPTFQYERITGKVVMLSSAGLVHKPNLHLTALAHEETVMTTDPLANIAAALGLPSTADQTEILTAINSQATPDPAQYVPIEAVADLMTSRNAALETVRETEVENTVQAAIDQGYISPAMRSWATSLCNQNPESFAEFTSTTAPAWAHLFTSKFDNRTLPNTKGRRGDAAELALCEQLDIDPGTLLDH